MQEKEECKFLLSWPTSAHSVTGQIAKEVIEGLQAAGHETELADLHAEGFDPSLLPADEPNQISSIIVESQMDGLPICTTPRMEASASQR